MILYGLGNPQKEYQKTYHNIGWEIINTLAHNNSVKLEETSEKTFSVMLDNGTILATSTVGMNSSGVGAKNLITYYNVSSEELCVIHDDIAMNHGKVKYKQGGGSSGGHNGIKSIEKELGSPYFSRLKVGVGHPPKGVSFLPYVLGERQQSELDMLTQNALSFMMGNQNFVHIFK